MDAKELKLELSKKGYATKALWHMDDVAETLNQYNDVNETNHRLTAWECSEIMDDVLMDIRVQELIFELLDEAVTKRIQ
jgi:hypothetical protein